MRIVQRLPAGKGGRGREGGREEGGKEGEDLLAGIAGYYRLETAMHAHSLKKSC